jgi:hypothetical protein
LDKLIGIRRSTHPRSAGLEVERASNPRDNKVVLSQVNRRGSNADTAILAQADIVFEHLFGEEARY